MTVLSHGGVWGVFDYNKTGAVALRKVQRMFAKIIKEMMDKGIVKEDDPALLAVELTAPAVLLIAQADRQPQCERGLLKSIERHVRHFCKVYMRED